MNTMTDYLAVNGANLYYEVIGEGDPLVLIHPRWTNSYYWEAETEILARRYAVIRYDVRGFGRSKMKTIRYSDVEDLRALLQHLGANHVFLMGLELGADIALHYTQKYGDTVRAIVAAAPQLEEFDWSEAFLAERQLYTDAVKAGDHATAFRQILKMWADNPTHQAPYEVHERIAELMRGYDFVHHQPLKDPYLLDDEPTLMEERTQIPDVEMLSHFGLEDETTNFVSIDKMPVSESIRLNALKHPTLIMVGEKDWREYHAMARKFKSAMPFSEQTVISGAGHYMNLEQPQTFMNAVMEFLRRH